MTDERCVAAECPGCDDGEAKDCTRLIAGSEVDILRCPHCRTEFIVGAS